MKRVEDRGGTATATKVEGTASVFPRHMVAGPHPDQLPLAPVPQSGVTVTGPGLSSIPAQSTFQRVLGHPPVAVYREGTTITPAPPQAHSGHAQHGPLSQPPSNIKPEPISLPNTPVSVQYTSFLPTLATPIKTVVSAPSAVTVAVTTPSGPVLHNMQIHPQLVQKVAHGAVAFGGGPPSSVRTTTIGQPGGQQPGGVSLPNSGGNPSFQRLKVEDALSYLDQVKYKFGNQPQVYNDFLDIMKEFKSQSIDTPGVISRVSMLFKGHPELIVGFNTFLPPGYKIEVQANENLSVNMPPGHQPHLQDFFQTIVHTPHGTHMMGVGGHMGPVIPASQLAATLPGLQTGGLPLPVRPVTVHQQQSQKYTVKTVNDVTASTPHDHAPHATPPSVVSAPVSHHNTAPPSSQQQPRDNNIAVYQQQQQPPANVLTSLAPPNLLSPHVNNQVTPSGGVTLPTLATPPGTGPGQQQPVEFNHAINYVNKIKNRFQGQPDVYKQFLEILHTYQKDQRAIKEGGAPKSHLTESEVYAQVSKLFQNQEDLLSEFGQFLPEATSVADGVTNAIMDSNKALANDHPFNSTNRVKPYNLVAPPQPTTKAPDPRPELKRPMTAGRMQPPAKKPRVGVLKDVSLAEAGKYGTLNEYAFFDKVRKALKSSEVYDNFLRCLVLFNQEIVSRPELIQLATPFLNKHPELFAWFKDFVGYREGGAPPPSELLPSGPTQPVRPERVGGEAAMEVDYASCKRLGASYCALPKNFVQPKCTGRGQGPSLCKEVLNDTWVSFPSWSEDSQFVTSRKTQYEEFIYRTEDERFEFDVVLETNRDTIKVLECVQKKMSRMPPEEAARYRLDDSLGGTSPTIHQRAIRRIYGDKSADIIDGLKRNPVVAVPLVLRRLKAKDQEWRDVQKSFNKVWREQNEKYYLKSLDHQGLLFKQNDIRAIRSKSLLNEVETLYDEQHEQEEQTGDIIQGPHITLKYKDKTVLDDATNLLIHHVKRQAGIHKEDKHRIKVFLRQSCPVLFFHQKQELSDDEPDDEESDGEDDDEGGGRRSRRLKEREGRKKDVEVKDEEVREEMKDGRKTPPYARDHPQDESYTILMSNSHWYLFFRLHQTLCERLATMYDHAVAIAADENEDKPGRKESTAVALRLKPKNGLSSCDYYPAFLDMVRSVLDGNMDSVAFEDTLREMFGIHAFTAFTLDKVVVNAVRQLQYLVTDDACQDCWDLHQTEKRNGGTGGSVSGAEERYFNELLYQKKAEKVLVDENCFKIIFYKNSGQLTVELLDTENGSRHGSEGEGDEEEEKNGDDKRLAKYVERFITPGDSVAEDTRSHLARKPVFLARSVRSYRRNTRHRLVPRPVKEVAENPEPSKPSRTESRLNLPDESIMFEDNTACNFNPKSLKILYVVNSENYIYKRRSLLRAKQSHPELCKRKFRNFSRWHSGWSAENVSESQQNAHNEWMMGRGEGMQINDTKRIQHSDQSKTPYRTFTKFKADMGKS